MRPDLGHRLKSVYRNWRGIAAVAATVASLALLASDGWVGPLSFALRRVIAMAALSGLAVVSFGSWKSWRHAIGWAGVVGLIALVARGPSTPVVLAAFTVALAAIWAASPLELARSVRVDGLVQACQTWLLVRLAQDLVPQIGRAELLVSGLAAGYRSRVAGVEADLSFTALGGPPVFFASVYLLWRWRLSGGMARLGLALCVPLAWFACTPLLAPGGASVDPLVVFNRATLHGVAWLAVAIMFDGVLPEDGRDRRAGLSAAKRWLLPAACVIAAIAGVCAVGTALVSPFASRKVVVHNRGGLDWDRPVFGRFGVFSGGMFGLLPVYCRAEGYEFGVIDKDAIRSDDLALAQTLVLINSPKSWPEAERRVVLDFIERGGSLLVLGDHTDVFGLMRGFNELLGDFGIRFRFDSAYKARENWRGCQAAAPDAIAWGWDAENPSVAVGASLELSGSARPLLTGRYGFSDVGVRENYTGSFLGNYRYDLGERVGDVVLIATATRGRGRVVVWGDTSAFQGGQSSAYAKVVGPILAWLSRPAAWTERPLWRWLAAAGLVAVIVGLWLARASATESAAVAASLLVGMLVAWGLSLPNLDARVHVRDDTILIDGSHLPASGHYEARVNPVGPLYTNLLRSGFRVVDQEDWDPSAIARARGIAFVAPQRSFSGREVEELVRAEESGAVIIMAVGQPDAAGSLRVLDAHGLAVAPRPLGTVTSATSDSTRRQREREPRFLDAWPIVTVDGGSPVSLPGVEVIFRRGDDVLALFRRKGRGGLLLFADTRFFADMNVEDVSGHWPGNLALIHDVFRRYLGADPDAVRPLFRSPEKPN